jgi:IgGFc binding protein
MINFTMERPFLLGLGALVFTGVFAQQPSSGTEFWGAFMPNAYGYELRRVHITASSAASGTVSMPLEGIVVPFTVLPGQETYVDLPEDSLDHFGGLGTNGIHVISSAPISVVAESRNSFTSDASVFMPTNGLGSTYRIRTYPGLPGFVDFYTSEFIIAAHVNGTVVDIVPSAPTRDGHPAGIPYQITLNAGETWLVMGHLSTSDLSGSTVSAASTNTPCATFAVFSGSNCANVPTGNAACDHLYEQELPVDRWGTSYYMAPLASVTASTLRVLAHANDTHVSVNGQPATTLQAGQWLGIVHQAGPSCIMADKPVSASQYMEGFNYVLAGDPSILTLTPDASAITNATFSTLGETPEQEHYLNVIAPTVEMGTVFVDGQWLDNALIAPFTACADMSYAQVPLTEGVHSLACSGCHGYVYGMATGESYGYALLPGEELLTVADTVVCALSGTALDLTAPLSITNPIWSAASDPGTIISTEPVLSVAAATNERYRVRDANSSVCEAFVYAVGLSDPLTVDLLIDGEAEDTVHRCLGEGNMALVQLSTSDAGYEHIWSGMAIGVVQASGIQVPAAHYAGWLRVLVRAVGGCAAASDSVWFTYTELPGTPVIFEQDDVLYCVLDGFQYQWLLNGEPITGATQQSYTPTTSGTYTVRVMDEYGCGVVSYFINIAITGLGEEPSNPVDMRYDPVQHALILNGQEGPFTVEVRSITGSLILAKSLGNERRLALPALPKGVYLATALTPLSKTTVRIVLGD